MENICFILKLGLKICDLIYNSYIVLTYLEDEKKLSNSNLSEAHISIIMNE